MPFQIVKRCELSTSKEICRLAYQGRVFIFYIFVYLFTFHTLISHDLVIFVLLVIQICQISIILLVVNESWIFLICRFNVWIIISREGGNALQLARSERNAFSTASNVSNLDRIA